jgi:hypothetical protein
VKKDKLTAKTVVSLKSPGYFSDCRGLYLQVSKTLSKSWLFIYKHAGGKFEVGLGSMDVKLLEKTRDDAHEYRKLLAAGVDPLTEKRKREQERLLANAKSLKYATLEAAVYGFSRISLSANRCGLRPLNSCDRT